MAPLLLSIVSGLVSKGMPQVADAVLDKGLDYVEQKMGVKLKPEEDLTDDDVKSLKERAMQHEEFMAEAQLKEMQSARNMQQEAMKSNDPLVRRFVYFFIAFWSLWSAVMLPFMVFGDIPADNVRFADTILGFLLATMIGSMFGFLLGSSLGSKEKDKK